MNSDIQELTPFNIKSKPVSGWICVKVYNDMNVNMKGCFDCTKTDIDQFYLYDYQEFLRNDNKVIWMDIQHLQLIQNLQNFYMLIYD